MRRSVVAHHRGGEQPDFGVAAQRCDGVGERVASQLHVGIEDQVQVGAQPWEHQVVAAPVAHIAMARHQLDRARLERPRTQRVAQGRARVIGAVVDDVERRRAEKPAFACERDRGGERGQRALEQQRVAAERDDGGAERDGRHARSVAGHGPRLKGPRTRSA